MKPCAECGENKPLDAYYKRPSTRDGRFGKCKVCVLESRRVRYEVDGDLLRERVRRYRAENPEAVQRTIQKRRDSDPDGYRSRNRAAQLRRYGMTQADYDARFESQGRRCAICRSDDSGPHWSIDHDHVTGAVRGILCWHCNVGLGHFRDDARSLIEAADYLIQARSVS